MNGSIQAAHGRSGLCGLDETQRPMDQSHILKVAVLADGCLGIFPDQKKGMFQYIYREAAGVYWDADLSCFKSTQPRDWDYKQWY